AADFRNALVDWLDVRGVPVSTPEYRRAAGKTPRLSASRVADLSPRPSAAAWQGGTVAQPSAPSGAGQPAAPMPASTPIASSSPSNLRITPPSRARRNAAIGAGAALLVGVVLFAVARSGNKQPTAAGPAPDTTHAPATSSVAAITTEPSASAQP